MSKELPTDPYKGVRDFYPEELAVRNYIFNTWRQTAQAFGYSEYDASILEPAELYQSKGAANAELVNDQTYTFTDRGDRAVTLRPEMTPTVARLVAKKSKELTFPIRWYSIPNLFRYERMQRGRLREHWQLNCDIFGSEDSIADVEIIALAHQTLINFGATEDMFVIKVNDRRLLQAQVRDKLLAADKFPEYLRLLDRKNKIPGEEFEAESAKLLKPDVELNIQPDQALLDLIKALDELGVNNVEFDSTITRGFDYYTGTVFEVFDQADENKRSLLGGGRYDNLTSLFGGEAVPGVGFGMGDVTVRDFLDTHNLLTSNITAPDLVVIPTETDLNLKAEVLASKFREAGFRVATDFSDRKLKKKIAHADQDFVDYILVVGEEEVKNEKYTIKRLADGSTVSGTLDELVTKLTA